MKPERWEQIEKVYEKTLRLKQSERAGFLVEACRGDEDMRREIDSLLQFQEKTNGFMEASAFDVVAQMISPNPDDADLTIGGKFAHYSVVEKLGSGGMGVVYKARDERLHRFVALKILPQSFTLNQERLRLFEREARSASALNHPNVVTVYEVGRVDSIPYIAMEFVEGNTLRQLLGRGPLPISDVLRLADQLAGGLAKIHASGLIHGDLKPENIMITEDGLAKILDFGLARLASIADVPTQSTATNTSNTGLAGTVSYMSPEQLLGRPKDFRSDQFSLGCILYEMVTGHGGFRRENMAQTRESIINGELESIGGTRPDVPKPFCVIVERCLEKEPAKRYESSIDLVKALRDFREAQAVPGIQASPRRRRILLAVAAVIVVLMPVGVSDRPVRQWLLGMIGVQSTNVESIAVLPLKADDDEAQIFANLMTVRLIEEIGQVNGLLVPGHITMLSYKNSKLSPQEIALDLKVDAVLKASLSRTNQSVTISVNLINATSGSSTSLGEFRKPMEEVLTLQKEVAKAVADQFGLKLTPKQLNRIRSGKKVNPEAYQSYTLGQYEFWKRTPEGLIKSSEYFMDATHQDPDFADAYAALANSYLAQGFNGILVPKEARQAARSAALNSLYLDDDNAEAHAAMGRILTLYEWDWSKAESEFLRAIDLNKNSSLVYGWYSNLLVATNRKKEAIEKMRLAVDLDPRSPMNHTNFGWILHIDGNYPEAISEYVKALKLDSNFTSAMSGLADVYEGAGKLDDEFDTLQKWAKGVGISTRDQAELEGAFRTGGPAVYWKVRVNMESAEEQNSGDQWPYFMASLNAKARNKEQALGWLEEASKEHNDHLIFLQFDPAFETLRTDPRFIELVRRMELP